MKLFLTTIAAVCMATSANAADICTGSVLYNIPASDGSYAAKRGTKIEAVTQYVKRGRQYLFCSHGGGCYSAFVKVKGKAIRAITLDNCSVDMQHPDASYDEIIYPVEVNRRRNSAVRLRYEDVDNRLIEMGLCSACAGTAANAYIKRPASPCGQLTRLALEGNPVARRRLLANDNACTAEWRK